MGTGYGNRIVYPFSFGNWIVIRVLMGFGKVKLSRVGALSGLVLQLDVMLIHYFRNWSW